MTNILLISEDFIKENSGLDDNVFGKFLLPTIRESQDIGLQSIIGTSLYKSICSMVEDLSIMNEENGKYKELLDEFIQPYLLYKTIEYIIPVVSTKISNMGAVISNDEHITNLGKNERDSLMDYYMHKADFYQARLQEYLCKNLSNFKELSNGCCGIKPNLDSSASCPIWLGGIRSKNKGK